MSADWTTCRVVRDRDGELWFRIRGDMWFDGDVRIGSEGLGRYGPITPVLDADGLPVVRTVGDLGTERGWTCDRPSDCDVEPHGSTPRKPLVIESVLSTLRIEGRQEPLGPAYLVMSAADDDWGDSVRIDLGIQDARLLSGWLGNWLRNKA